MPVFVVVFVVVVVFVFSIRLVKALRIHYWHKKQLHRSVSYSDTPDCRICMPGQKALIHEFAWQLK